MLRPRAVRSDVGEVHFRLLARGQLDLRLLRRFLQTLLGERILAQINAVRVLELLGEVVDKHDVEIFPTEEGITVGGEHFELVLAIHFRDFNDGHVEGAAPKVVNGDLRIPTLLVHAVGQGSGRGLVDDALHLETGNAARVLRRLTLGIVEVGRNGDDRFRDLFPEVILGGLLHLFQHFCRNLGRGHLLPLRFHPGVAVIGLHNVVGHHADIFLHDAIVEAAADQALHRKEGIRGVGHRLALGGLTHEDLAVLRVGDDGGGGAIPFCVFNNLRVPALEDDHTGIRGAEVDANNLAHESVSKLWGRASSAQPC